LRPAQPERLNEILDRLVASTRLRDIIRNRNIFSAWNESVDPAVGEHTRVMGFRGGVLTVACDSHALASELSAFKKTELLELMENAVGRGKIRLIKFVVEDDIGQRT
jgi:predicted nucleic acid-binding Zn ribbon protein